MFEIQRGNRSGENVLLLIIDIKGLKYKYQMGVVVPVVYTLTYVYRMLILFKIFSSKLTRKYTA